MAELLHISFSPWSEKARWALDARRVPHHRRAYLPLLGELELRRKLKRWRGNVSVPVLFDGLEHFDGSWAIAHYADARGEGPRLFPAGHELEIDRYNRLSERGLAAGRGLGLPRMLADEQALAEQLPRALRKSSGKLGHVIAALGVKRTIRKYAAHELTAEQHEQQLIEVLESLRAELNGRPTLLDEFSFADIAMAQVLAFVLPPRTGLKMGEGSRRAFTLPALAERYADLLAWRDALYEAHRAAP